MNPQDEATFFVKVTPRSHTDLCEGFEEHGPLRIRLRAIPKQGDANAALIDFLAKILHHPKTKIQIRKGKTSRLKEIFIQGLSLQEVQRKLTLALSR